MKDQSTTQAWNVNPGSRLEGECTFPGDKSISHRALIFASLAPTTTRLTNLSNGQDVSATARAFSQMGVNIAQSSSYCDVVGAGLGGLQASAEPLDMGNSGTAMRLLSGVLAGQRFSSTLTGDASLSGRPMARIRDPLRQMGAQIQLSAGDTAPIRIEGGACLQAIEYQMPVASAQIQSCLLLAGLYAQGRTCINSPLVCRDHSERALRLFQRPVHTSTDNNGYTICLDNDPEQALISPQVMDIPGDLSSAAFFIVAGTLAEQGSLCLRGVNLNPTRDGVVRILQRMGAQIEISNPRQSCNEPVVDLTITPASLKAVQLDAADVALAIDEIPVLAIACAGAVGTSRIRGARELRVKESDRIASTARILSMLGVAHQCYEDGIDIEGINHFAGGVVDADGDHRIAMSAAIAATRARKPIHIKGVETVASSFPGFAQTANQLGLQVQDMTQTN